MWLRSARDLVAKRFGDPQTSNRLAGRADAPSSAAFAFVLDFRDLKIENAVPDGVRETDKGQGPVVVETFV